MVKPILCFDFDGVIHSYESGWKGAEVIPDPPTPGAIEYLCMAMEYFTVAVFSSRTNQSGGLKAMQKYIEEHAKKSPDYDLMPTRWWKDIMWPTSKPPAMVTIDDRAIQFTGEWPDLDGLKKFKPWNKKVV